MSTIPAHRFPARGLWSEEDYLRIDTNKLVELSDGNLEVLAMPTEFHQLIALLIFRLLDDWARTHRAGRAIAAPFKIRLWADKMREPDVMFMARAHDHRRQQQYWDGADFVVEVISPDDPDRDLVTKRAEYAQAGIPEYWIVDPRTSQVTVLKLSGDAYEEHGIFGRGGTVASATLDGFTIDVSAVFDASAD